MGCDLPQGSSEPSSMLDVPLNRPGTKQAAAAALSQDLVQPVPGIWQRLLGQRQPCEAAMTT